jgi:hypothetical protein
MSKYRAIVSFTFDDGDLADLAENLGIYPSRLQPDDAINGEIDNLSFCSGWLEQLFRDGQPTIRRLTGDGISVEISPHEED